MENRDENKIFSLSKKIRFMTICILIIVIGTASAILFVAIGGEKWIKCSILCFWAVVISVPIVADKFIKKYRWLSDEAKEESPLVYYSMKMFNISSKIFAVFASFICIVLLLGGIW